MHFALVRQAELTAAAILGTAAVLLTPGTAAGATLGSRRAVFVSSVSLSSGATQSRVTLTYGSLKPTTH